MCGAVSRRHADDLVKAGRVSINGKRARPGDTAQPFSDEVRLDGRRLTPQETVVLALYKPKNVLSTLRDPQGRPCIRDLIPPGLEGVFPVGRLDYDACGLIILTNDGDIAHALHHPSFSVPKTYVVKVKPRASEQALQAMAAGLRLDGRMTLPASVELIHSTPEGSSLRITLTQGLKNQIKRMAACVGLRVVGIKRICVGPVTIRGMSPGELRPLSAFETRALHNMLKKRYKTLT
jgi:pseudouridine synthase